MSNKLRNTVANYLDRYISRDELQNAIEEFDNKAHITWSWEDVKSIRKNWSKDKCQEALNFTSCHFQEPTERVLEVLNDVLDIFEITRRQ